MFGCSDGGSMVTLFRRVVFHGNNIKIAATEEVTEVTVSALSQRFLTEHLGEVD